jgi:hypothetical protein
MDLFYNFKNMANILFWLNREDLEYSRVSYSVKHTLI